VGQVIAYYAQRIAYRGKVRQISGGAMKKVLVFTAVFLIAVSIISVWADRCLKAEEEAVGAEISKKLDDVLKGQKQILDAIAALKAELNIIKIRITQTQ
jgi:hypothetical protein